MRLNRLTDDAVKNIPQPSIELGLLLQRVFNLADSLLPQPVLQSHGNSVLHRML